MGARHPAPKKSERSKVQLLESCPHCGEKLSPWQQVLLGVDRALMCKHCWYRIILDVEDEQENKSSDSQPPSKE